jgi:flagellar hook-basal body complex protein FliE
MSISSITGFQPLPLTVKAPQAAITATPEGKGFTDRISDAVQSLAKSQSSAAEAAADFETGKRSDLAAVMVEQQIASLGFQFTLNVRNKALGAYRDIMNMPV